MLALVVLEGIVILLLGVLVAGLLRSHAEILRRLEALGAGEDVTVPARRPAPAGGAVAAAEVTGATPAGGTASVPLVGSRGHTLLAFLSTGCSTCRPFWHQLAEQAELPWPDVRPVVVTRGPESESPGEVAALAPPGVTTIMSSEAWDAFRVPGTPFFQLVDAATGRVEGEGSAAGWHQLVDLVRRALGDGAAPADRRHAVHLSTRERLRDSDEELRRAGIRPGDGSLFGRPGAER